MKMLVLGGLLVASFFSFGQMPYKYATEDTRQCLAVYHLDGSADGEFYIRIFEDYIESVAYYEDSSLLAELFRIDYLLYKNKYILVNVIGHEQVLKYDTLSFIKDFHQYNYHYLEEGNNVQIQNLAAVFAQPVKKHSFYSSKLDALLQFKPRVEPIVVNEIVEPWYTHPNTDQSLVCDDCTNGPNLNCLLAALQCDKKGQKKLSQDIAAYLIERFSYGYGDTSQYKPEGLLLSSQNLAVCAGYSQMYHYLLEKSGIASKYVDGAVRLDYNDMFYSGHSHAWNELEIDSIRMCSDVTWALGPNSDWLFNSEENFFLTHFRDPSGDAAWDKKYTKTMYEFMHQPMVRNPSLNAAKELTYLYNPLPMQFAKDKFEVIFTQPIGIHTISFHALSYPFVKFESEKSETKACSVSSGTPIYYAKKANRISFDLVDQFTSISVNIAGIGTIDYCVFNGTQEQFYAFLIDHIDAHSPYSVAMAFMACAKLNDMNAFNKLKKYLKNPKMSFKTFQKQANTFATSDFIFALFNATEHFGDFRGFSFEYSNDKKEPRIYISSTDDRKTYSFAGFNTSHWNLPK